jgi:hypothetical protein
VDSSVPVCIEHLSLNYFLKAVTGTNLADLSMKLNGKLDIWQQPTISVNNTTFCMGQSVGVFTFRIDILKAAGLNSKDSYELLLVARMKFRLKCYTYKTL